MFTGIIEEMGTIKNMAAGKQSYHITISADKVTQGTKTGDSIAVNGICLTVTAVRPGSFEADVMAETVRRTSLSSLHTGSRVNLERALTLSGRLGGHIVSGHIDGTGRITHIEKEDNAVWLTVDTPRELLRYMVEKGSVAVDGVSLTIAYVDKKCFKVSIIPHTGEATILLGKNIGDPVNLECDIIGKYVEKLLYEGPADPGENVSKSSAPGASGITKEFLTENGFM